MKKFLGILAIAGVLVACDNAGSNEQRQKDSLDSVKRADSLKNAMPTPPVVTVDSPVIKVDSPVIKVDSPAHK